MSSQSHPHALIAGELQLPVRQVEAVAGLLQGGATVPFIARYRKEATGSLDEVAITRIRDRLAQLAELEERRKAILKSLEERELLTPALSAQIGAAATMVALEDLYLPYRPKRRTRATMAREKGLEPLADALLERMTEPAFDVNALAAKFISAEKGVATGEDALAGARDILAERVSEDSTARSAMRDLFSRKATLQSTAARGGRADEKYRDYFEWEEPLNRAPSHRVLAMFRGEEEKSLALQIRPPEEEAQAVLRRLFVKGRGSASEQVALAVADGYRRLLGPSMETEIRSEVKRRADEAAIRVFAENLRELLMASPLGGKTVLALDPGFRTGCKLVCLDRHGRLLHHETVYPHTGDRRNEEAGKNLKTLVDRYRIDVIAIGNGTASRETEAFVRGLGLPKAIPVLLVNESGASIYSASDVAREEFPDQDVTVRGAVSIGRRLMDPLAELVKIDPKSIGVGQYQHDVDPNALKAALDDVVVSCVNRVGVDVNTASKELLRHVSGLGPQLAKNIVAHRSETGPFASRQALKKVKGLGPRAFEQAAGFLRIPGGEHPLDGSAVHPESYPVVEAICRDLGCRISDLLEQEALRQKIVPERYVTPSVGLPTLRDILEELAKPGRDPRQQFEAFEFAEGVTKMEDLKAGMKLPGIVTNVTAFGAFVDVGVHQDGLVHISHLADRFVKNPSEVVKVHQKVTVTVLQVDLPRKRIGLSMKSQPFG
ncbi:MAG: RNA-binding transcriptional accessory protein [Armatimonadetes bacterium]|nr:RNA-binding transcriptional accessory protein [Armatimonadota bacterium]